MIDDFIVPDPTPTTPSKNEHVHNWFMAQRGSEFNLINPGNNRLYEKVEYAYLICKVCAEVCRTAIKDKDDL